MSELWELSAAAAATAVAKGDAAPAELLEASLGRIESLEPAVHAWAYLDAAAARAQLVTLESGPLHGVPAGIKDIFNTRDMPTGMGSAVWADFTPGNDARVVHNAREAGALVVGKTVTAEFAVHAPGPTRNPRSARHAAGTSSSGSAAAVACGMVPWALGSQTAGSIVRPASYCGVYGYKPTYGLIPRTGMLKTTDTLDQIGWFHRDPVDARLLLDALRLSGADYPLIHRHLDCDPGRTDRPLRMGLITDSLHTWETTSDESRRLVVDLADRAARSGFDVAELTLPSEFRRAHTIHATIYDRCIAYYFAGEAEQDHLVSDEIIGMIDRGRAIGLAAYVEALDAQETLRRSFATVVEPFDVVLSPSVAGLPPLVEDREVDDAALVWSLIGAPVVSIPVFELDLPLARSVQLVGPRYGDLRVLDALELLAERDLIRAAPIATPEPCDD